MTAVKLGDAAKFFRDLGALHDCTIKSIGFDAEARRIDLSIEDMAWGVEDGAGHRPRPGIVRMANVSAFSISAGQDKLHTGMLAEHTMISEVLVLEGNDVLLVDIVMQTNERWFVECQQLLLVEP